MPESNNRAAFRARRRSAAIASPGAVSDAFIAAHAAR